MAQPVTKHHRPKTQFFSTLLGPLYLAKPSSAGMTFRVTCTFGVPQIAPGSLRRFA